MAGQGLQTFTGTVPAQSVQLLDEGASEALICRQVPEDALMGDEGGLMAGFLSRR